MNKLRCHPSDDKQDGTSSCDRDVSDKPALTSHYILEKAIFAINVTSLFSGGWKLPEIEERTGRFRSFELPKDRKIKKRS